LSHTVSDSNAILLIKGWIIWLFIHHSCLAPTLSSTGDTKMSKTRFFFLFCWKCFPFYFRNQIYAACKASNCTLNSTTNIKKLQMDFAFLFMAFCGADLWVTFL
jgi:hypothetical protein